MTTDPMPTPSKWVLRQGMAVSWLSLQGVKVFGVIEFVYGNGTCRVALPSGQSIHILTNRLTRED